MSIQESDLAIFQNISMNVDMTVSVAERALNSQLRQYLASMSTAPKAGNYQVKLYILSYCNDDGKHVMFNVEKDTDYSTLPKDFPSDIHEHIANLKANGKKTLFEELEELNLFNIKSGTKASINLLKPSTPTGDALKIQTASGYYVKYGIFIEDGIPDHALMKMIDPNFKGNPDDILKPITLQPNTKNVLFRQFFRNICGVQISSATSGAYPNLTVTTTLTKSEQTGDKIWYFPFQISLDFRATDYALCGEDVQKKIQQMANVKNPDDVFNISQLALDLKTLSTTMTPTITEFDHDVDTPLTNLIRAYFDRLDKAGQTVFGSVITTTPKSTTKYLFTPKMRNYHVAPRTLNYLIGFGDEFTIPNLGNYSNLPWDSDSSPLIAANNTADAAIAISSASFIPFIREMVRPVLNYLPNKINVSCSDTFMGSFSYGTSSNPQYGNPNFSISNTKPLKLSYSFEHESQTDRCYVYTVLGFPGASTKLKHRYYASALGQSGYYNFGGTLLPAFVFDINIRAWLLIDYNTNESCKGTYFDQTIQMAVGIKVDSDGNIGFVKNDAKWVDNKPGGIPQSDWVKFMSFGEIMKYVDRLKGNLTPILSNVQSQSIDVFSRSVNSQIGFVMPGSKTFTFAYDKPNGKVNAITPSGDLYLFGNYVQELAK